MSSSLAQLPAALRPSFEAAFAPGAGVPEAVAAMQALDGVLPPTDGVAIFNRMYAQVTQSIDAALALAQSPFQDPAFMVEFDVRFARLFLAAVVHDASRAAIPRAWRPLFEARHARDRYPIQFAIAGMNTHIEHDLAHALVATCRARGKSLRLASVRHDYEAINDLLAALEPTIRRSFLDELGQTIDDHVGPAVHLVSSWQIDAARDVAWASAETLWALRNTRFAYGAYCSGLERTVGMASRMLLTPLRQ